MKLRWTFDPRITMLGGWVPRYVADRPLGEARIAFNQNTQRWDVYAWRYGQASSISDGHRSLNAAKRSALVAVRRGEL